jgi:hypothetical protein
MHLWILSLTLLDIVLGCTLLVHISLCSCVCLQILWLLLHLVYLTIILWLLLHLVHLTISSVHVELDDRLPSITVRTDETSKYLEAEPIGHALLDIVLGCTLLVHISLCSCVCLQILWLLLHLVYLTIIAQAPSLVWFLHTLGQTCNYLSTHLVLFGSVI